MEGDLLLSIPILNRLYKRSWTWFFSTFRIAHHVHYERLQSYNVTYSSWMLKAGGELTLTLRFVHVHFSKIKWTTEINIISFFLTWIQSKNQSPEDLIPIFFRLFIDITMYKYMNFISNLVLSSIKKLENHYWKRDYTVKRSRNTCAFSVFRIIHAGLIHQKKRQFFRQWFSNTNPIHGEKSQSSQSISGLSTGFLNLILNASKKFRALEK